MALICIDGVSECCGCMNCQKSQIITCPVCGESPKNNYYFQYGAIIGCDNCTKKIEYNED